MKHILLITNIFISLALMASDGLFEDSKKIIKTFPTSNDFELEITNKHGDIIMHNWSKDSIMVKVLIHGSSQKLDRLNTLMQQIDVRFTDHSDYLGISTEWGSNSNGFKVDIMKLFDNQTVTVDYEIYLPDGVEIEIENKFGDVVLDDCNGKLKVDLSHGDLSTRHIEYAKSIKIQFGDCKIKSILKGDIIAKFSDINIEHAGKLNMDLTSCELEVERMEGLVLKSTSDEIEIEEIDDLSFGASLSNIEIEKCNKKISGQMKFGTFEVEEVVATFNAINLTGTNTDIQLDFEEGIAYSYNVQLEKGKSFSIPSQGNNLENDNLFEDVHQYEGLFATVPVGGKPASVSVVAKQSYIRFGTR